MTTAAISADITTRSPAPRARFEPADPPLVSFIVVTFGTGHIVVDSLASLANSLDGTPAECIVVDNEHPTEPNRTWRELLLGTDGVRVLRPGWNLGFAGGCELGAMFARSDVLAFVNPDVFFEPGWLPPLLDALQDRSVSIAAPVLLEPDGSVQEAGQSLRADGSTWPNRLAPLPDEVATVTYSSAACWLIRSEEHERLGGFDPVFHPAYYEDADLALRAASAGRRCVVHGASRVVHHHGASTASRAMPDTLARRADFLARWPGVSSLGLPAGR